MQYFDYNTKEKLKKKIKSEFIKNIGKSLLFPIIVYPYLFYLEFSGEFEVFSSITLFFMDKEYLSVGLAILFLTMLPLLIVIITIIVEILFMQKAFKAIKENNYLIIKAICLEKEYSITRNHAREYYFKCSYVSNGRTIIDEVKVNKVQYDFINKNEYFIILKINDRDIVEYLNFIN